MKTSIIAILAIPVVLCLCVGTTWAGIYGTTFEAPTFTPGSISGQDGWSLFDTNVANITTGSAYSGIQSLQINTSVGNGDVAKLASPTFAAVGETNCIYNQHPATNSVSYDFWFRTVKSSADLGLYVSSSLGCAASVRNTYLGIGEGNTANIGQTPGNLYAVAYAVDASGNFNPAFSPSLNWGQWYHASVDATFVDGPNNDLVQYEIRDSNGNLVWDTTIGSWENYYVTDLSAEQAPGPIASNRVSFGWSPTSGTDGVYIDNFDVSGAVPEPATIIIWSLLGGLGLVIGWRRKRAA
jgi:hypothetical protein